MEKANHFIIYDFKNKIYNNLVLTCADLSIGTVKKIKQNQLDQTGTQNTPYVLELNYDSPET